MNRSKSFAIGFVLFHPTEKLAERLALAEANNFEVYIFDNTPGANKPDFCITEKSRIRYITAGNNLGLGIGLSAICATAYADGHNSLLFFDQDTGFTIKTLDFVSTKIQRYGVETAFLDDTLITSFSAEVVDESEIAIQTDIEFAISSGSLISLNNLRKIGWYNRKYFVDCVDYELCVRARALGYKIKKISHTPDFDHVTEQPDEVFIIFGKKLTLRKYNHARILDSIGAYARLLVYCISIGSLNDVYRIARSAFIYCLGQVLSRVISIGK